MNMSKNCIYSIQCSCSRENKGKTTTPLTRKSEGGGRITKSSMVYHTLEEKVSPTSLNQVKMAENCCVIISCMSNEQYVYTIKLTRFIYKCIHTVVTFVKCPLSLSSPLLIPKNVNAFWRISKVFPFRLI